MKELTPGVLEGRKWVYRDSPVMAISQEAAQAYDDTLKPMEKKHMPSQEEFYIMSQSFLGECLWGSGVENLRAWGWLRAWLWV